jgi:hypothetical protein
MGVFSLTDRYLTQTKNVVFNPNGSLALLAIIRAKVRIHKGIQANQSI